MKLLLAALFAIGLASMPIAQAAACSCAQLGSDTAEAARQAAEAADAVFAGTVVNETPVGADPRRQRAVAATVPFPPPMGQTIYTFAVDGVAKGPIGTQVEVVAGGDGASCGFTFEMNQRWLVFATWDGAMYGTGLCSGNVTLGADAEAPLPLTAPSGDSADTEAAGIPTPALALLGIIGVVLAVSWLAFRRGASPAS
jgi:hypothetical protein